MQKANAVKRAAEAAGLAGVAAIAVESTATAEQFV